MNLVIKPIEFEYEDTNFCEEDYKYISAYGVYDWYEKEVTLGPNSSGKTWSIIREPDAAEWIAAFVKKEDAEFYLNWKKSQ